MLLLQKTLVIIASLFTVISICGIPSFLERHLSDEAFFLIVFLSVLIFFALLAVVLIYLLSLLLMRCFKYYLESLFSDAGWNSFDG